MTREAIHQIVFGRTNSDDELEVEALSSGEVDVKVSDDVGSKSCTLALDQAMALRDFLNEHVDRLAVQHTTQCRGDWEVSTKQLAAVEEVPVKQGCGQIIMGPHAGARCGASYGALCQECGGLYERFDPDRHLF